MKNKNIKKSKQTLKLQIYEVLIRELLIILTASGVKLPEHVMKVVSILFPNHSDMDTSQIVQERRCSYCKHRNKCMTSMYRFQVGGCGDKFKKSILFFWKKDINSGFISKKGINVLSEVLKPDLSQSEQSEEVSNGS